MGIRRVRLTRRHLQCLVAGYAAAAVTATALLLVLDAGSAETSGLRREVYPEVGFTGTPLVDDVSPEVTLDFIDADPTLPQRNFSIRWRGFWYVPETTEVDLHGAGDDRLDVWLDGELVIRRTPPADMHALVRTVTLEAGIHNLRVEYEQHGGARALRLGWARRGGRPAPLPPHRLFHAWPNRGNIRVAHSAAWLGPIVSILWAAPVLASAAFLARRAWRSRARWGPGSTYDRYWQAGRRAALVSAVAAVSLQALLARLPGWNPASLWADDLVYGSLVRSQDFWTMVTAPIHAAPGPFVLWRALYAVFPDPEWSLQLLPFASGIAAIPVMALLARKLTGDDSIAAGAAAVTALNPLMAHYTVFVHQYTLDFLATALFLLAAAHLRHGESGVDPRRFRWMSLGGGVATLLSVPSVFVSFPIVNLGAACAARAWARDRRRAIETFLWAGVYNATVFLSYLFLRGRSNDMVRDDFATGFMPTDSARAAWIFLAENGRHLLELSLPSWGDVEIWNPATVSWPLPFVGLGLAGLLARRPTRFVGLVVGGFYAALVVASAMYIYPLGTGRPDIFAFPAAIALFAAGIHFATASLPRAELFRLGIAAVMVSIAVANPVRAEYWDVNDVHLIDDLQERLQPDEGLILSSAGSALIAFYGRWPVTITADRASSNGIMQSIDRDRTLYLDGGPREGAHVARFLDALRPARTWYVAFRTSSTETQVIGVMERNGYSTRQVRETRRGRLYLAERRGS